MSSTEETRGPNSDSPIPMDRTTAVLVLNFLKRQKLEATAEEFKKEANVSDEDLKELVEKFRRPPPSVSMCGDKQNPDAVAYVQLKNFVEKFLLTYKYEVGQILWPVFVYMYLDLVCRDEKIRACQFFTKFSEIQENFHEPDLIALKIITKQEHLQGSIYEPLVKIKFSESGSLEISFSRLYLVRISKKAARFLYQFLTEDRVKLVRNIVENHIIVRKYEGVVRGRAAVDAVAGYFMGEAPNEAKKLKVYYGPLEGEQEPLEFIDITSDDEEHYDGLDLESAVASIAEPADTESAYDEGSNSSDKSCSDPNLKRNRFIKGKPPIPTPDPSRPPFLRMPLPYGHVSYVPGEKAAKLPSIAMCTITAGDGDKQVTCVNWSGFARAGTYMAVGFVSASIKVWFIRSAYCIAGAMNEKPVKPSKTKQKSGEGQTDVKDKETCPSPWRCLKGHTGAIYSLDFSVRNDILSASEDSTIRLWSMDTSECLITYIGGQFPVWKAVFSPDHHYFASCGNDKTARLWRTDMTEYLRIFAGHYSDVTTVQFHPNSNYIATGSADRSVRLWDNVSGKCVRLLTGHKGVIKDIKFPSNGRFLVSGATDGTVRAWDLSNGSLLKVLTKHEGPVYSLSFNNEGSILATTGLDRAVRLWNFTGMTQDVDTVEHRSKLEEPDESDARLSKNLDGSKYYIKEFLSTEAATYALHFNRMNVLLVAGPAN